MHRHHFSWRHIFSAALFITLLSSSTLYSAPVLRPNSHGPDVIRLQHNLQRLEKELNWYTQKFDYRNQDAPWGDSKDALERTVNKLRGWCLGPEPMEDDAH